MFEPCICIFCHQNIKKKMLTPNKWPLFLFFSFLLYYELRKLHFQKFLTQHHQTIKKLHQFFTYIFESSRIIILKIYIFLLLFFSFFLFFFYNNFNFIFEFIILHKLLLKQILHTSPTLSVVCWKYCTCLHCKYGKPLPPPNPIFSYFEQRYLHWD